MGISRTMIGTLALALTFSVATTENEDTSPHVDLTAVAAVDGNTVDVTGDLAHGGIQEAGTDPSGDATVPNIATDLTRATLQQDGDVLIATVEIADGIPTAAGLPEAVQYNWSLTAGPNTYSLSAWRSATWQSGTPGEVVLAVQTCAPDPQTGQGTCVSDPVGGDFTETHIRWEIPFAKISAVPGVQLAPAGVIYASPGAAGRIWLNDNSPVLFDTMPHDTLFTIGGEVTAELLDGAGEVVSSRTTTAADGGFDLSFSGVPAGDYTVAVSSTYADVEGLVDIPITVNEPLACVIPAC